MSPHNAALRDVAIKVNDGNAKRERELRMKLWVMLSGMWSALRLWLMVSFWTVVCSALLTYFLLHQGGQLEEEEAPAEPPVLEWVSATHGAEPAELISQPPLAVITSAKASTIGAVDGINIKLRNDGKGALKIGLVWVSCGCSKVALDGKSLEVVGDIEPTPTQLGVVQPEKEGTLAITWKSEEKHRGADGKFRLSVTLNVNDPRFADRARLEITTELQDPKP